MFCRNAQLPFDNSRRHVRLYSLKERGGPNDFVVYCSDGQSTGAYAQKFFNEFGDDSFWFVGVDSSTERRNAEYVIGRDEACFRLHESFFSEDVLDWSTKTIGIKHSRNRSAVFGYSCGGAFAVSMGIRHPEIYGTILAFSIAGRPITNFESQIETDVSDVEFYFRAGSREPGGMRNYMHRLMKWLRSAQIRVCYETYPGGHEFTVWSTGLNESIALACELTDNTGMNHRRGNEYH